MRGKYYSELNEIPLFNFEKCMEGDYSYIRKDDKDKWGKGEVMAFVELYEKYVQKYNKKDLESKISLYKSLIQLQCAYVETGEDYFLTQIEIKKSSIPKAKESPKSNTIETLLILGQYTGYRLDPKEVTVDEYYTLIQLYERANKKV